MNAIDNISKEEYKEVVEIWEASVRATHDFLKEEDIEYFKPLILNTYLDAVELKCIRNNDRKIVGFLGVADQNLEMLFIDPDFRGKGIGKALLNYSIHKLNVRKVDVNEQNEQAVGFYKHFGFEVIKRSDLDSSGKPFPTLHMELKKNYLQERG
ncbi:MAG: acetyltransferase [Cytophagales bacterium]|uniref:acetyltransferase n=1 Tax=Cyclobacterium marinum TaxID=104 RepID=UPI0030D83ECD|nr:acetyltransferase [Cytophagales bacterium]|tara:strand:+ start:182 stop:643 length:462 start_codon:yes stop_codon:yes gene_type:complete